MTKEGMANERRTAGEINSNLALRFLERTSRSSAGQFFTQFEISDNMERTFELCRWGRSFMIKFPPRGCSELGRLG